MRVHIPNANKRKRKRRKVSSDIMVLWDPKSRACKGVIALLRGQGHEPMVVRYLEKPPTVRELEGIAHKLGVHPRALVNTDSDVFRAQGLSLSDDRSTAAWLHLLSADPRLLKCPIVVRGDRAVIALPPDKVRVLLQEPEGM